MSITILLDTGPLGLLTHPSSSPGNKLCNQWLTNHLANGNVVLVTGISDYELRREYFRRNNQPSLNKLNTLKKTIGYIPIDEVTMIEAAKLWALARNMNKATASDAALDGDMILSAHARILSATQPNVIVATTNVKHLTHFCNADIWQNII
jgi:hypothetical protein